MVLSLEQSLQLYQPVEPDAIYLAFQNSNPAFWAAINFIQALDPRWNSRPYALESTLTAANAPVYGPFKLTDAGAPPLVVASLPVIPWATNLVPLRAIFQITRATTPYVEQPQDKLIKNGDYQQKNVLALLEQIARSLIVCIIRRTSAPAADLVGSFQALLAGYTNTTPALAQGYSAAVLTEQTVVVGGRLMQRDLTAGTLTISDITPILTAIDKVKPAPDYIIVPRRFFNAYARNMQNGGEMMPWIDADMLSGFPASPQITGQQPRIPLLQGIPMIVVPDFLYTAAGHTVVGAPGAASYDLYMIRSARSLEDGVGVAYLGPENLATGVQAMTSGQNGVANLSEIPMGVGMSVYLGGKIASAAGLVNAMARDISANWQLTAGTKDAVCIISTVTD